LFVVKSKKFFFFIFDFLLLAASVEIAATVEPERACWLPENGNNFF